MADKHLMVVGGHISDPENMAGALMLKHRRAGWDVTIVAATPGEKGHPTLPPEEYVPMRMEDAQASAAFIGANLEVMPYKDGELPVDEESTWLMADLIRRYRPTVILTHWKGSMHRDHTHTYEIVNRALFKAALPAFKREHPAHAVRALLYPENWEDMEDYVADVYVDVSEVFEDYLKLLRTHVLMRENYASFRYYDYYEALGRTRGALAGFERAVTLMRPRSIYNFERQRGLLLD
ncbi:MAG: PIG-L family deacetylase [Anaerolineae bacterium]|nr:PIG-L family deacetylase [Anaerolineae bacterium]